MLEETVILVCRKPEPVPQVVLIRFLVKTESVLLITYRQTVIGILFVLRSGLVSRSISSLKFLFVTTTELAFLLDCFLTGSFLLGSTIVDEVGFILILRRSSLLLFLRVVRVLVNTCIFIVRLVLLPTSRYRSLS